MGEVTNPELTVVGSVLKAATDLDAQSADLAAAYAEHATALLTAAFRLSGSLEDAEDVLQTVFARLAARPELLPSEPETGPYLRRAAVNAALDLARQRLRRPQAAYRDELVNARRTSGVEPGAEAVVEVQRIRSALAELSPRAATMVVLRYVEGYSNQEIGRMLGTSANVVGVLLHRARARLRAALAQGDHA